MTTPRTKKMLLLAAATMATPVVASSCSNESLRGFRADVAYDSGYEDSAASFSADGSRTPANPEAGKDNDADTSDADADIADAAADAAAEADADQ